VTADSAWTTKLATEPHFHGRSLNTQFTSRNPLKITESCGQTNTQKRKLNIFMSFSKPMDVYSHVVTAPLRINRFWLYLLRQFFLKFTLNLGVRLGGKYRSFATRVSQLIIWHFWVIGTERNVCRCTFNRYSVITQLAKLAAGEQLCRRCTLRKLEYFKTFKSFSWKIADFELWHCCRKMSDLSKPIRKYKRNLPYGLKVLLNIRLASL